MCGIVGCFSPENCYEKLYSALTRLEYRGYDSAGIALLSAEGRFSVRKKKGGVASIAGEPLPGETGIGHTRWATHGAPSDGNAHPHLCGKFALVHNGIVENEAALRAELLAAGEQFLSETDSELIVRLIARAYRGDFFAAVASACARLEGSYAVAVLCADFPGEIVCARRGSPLVAGAGGGALYVCSDVPALCGAAEYICPAEDGEFVVIRGGKIGFCRADGTPIPKIFTRVRASARPRAVQAGSRMQAEIAEIPRALGDTLASLRDADFSCCRTAFRSAKRLLAVGCGTAYHAALCLRAVLEESGVFLSCRPASEAAGLCAGGGDLLIAVSQSGETADTLAAARAARERGAFVLAVTNVGQSSLASLAHCTAVMCAGPETAVAATKSYNCQLLSLYFLAARILACRMGVPPAWAGDLAALPAAAERAFGCFPAVDSLAEALVGARGMYFLGRGADVATAREGALKVKEIAYLAAEGLPAGELKHGPLALVEDGFPVALLATVRSLARKCEAAAAEVAARGGRVALFSQYGEVLASSRAAYRIRLPAVAEALMPAVSVIPLQYFACRLCLLRGLDPDRPRNLAKSVTVE